MRESQAEGEPPPSPYTHTHTHTHRWLVSTWMAQAPTLTAPWRFVGVCGTPCAHHSTMCGCLLKDCSERLAADAVITRQVEKQLDTCPRKQVLSRTAVIQSGIMVFLRWMITLADRETWAPVRWLHCTDLVLKMGAYRGGLSQLICQVKLTGVWIYCHRDLHASDRLGRRTHTLSLTLRWFAANNKSVGVERRHSTLVCSRMQTLQHHTGVDTELLRSTLRTYSPVTG